MRRWEWAGAVLLALCVSLVYGFPQILYFTDGYRYALILQTDEVYPARVRDVMDGHWRVADPYLWEHKGDPPVLPYGAELILGGLATLLGLSIDATIIAVRLLAPAIITGLLVYFLRLLTGSVGWALVGTALTLLEPGTYYYKPFFYVTRLVLGYPDTSQMSLLYTRITNPLVLIIPFILAAAVLYRALLTRKRRDVILAGIAVGLNFYSQVFYWAYLYAGMFILALIYICDREHRIVLLTVGTVGILCGSYAVGEQLLASATVPRGDLLPRIGVLLKIREPLNLFPKGLLVVAALFAFLSRKRDLRYYFLLSFVAGGYLLLNQNVVTGLEIQNYHFNYGNAIFASAAMIVLVQTWVSKGNWMFQGERGTLVGRVAATTAVVWLFGNALGLQAKSYAEHMRAPSVAEGAYPSNLKRGFGRTLDWINTHTPVDSVFLADPQVSFLIPIYTHGNVFLDPLQNDHGVSSISDDELFERWIVYLRLQGLSREEVFARVKYREPVTIPGWPFGRNRVLRARYDISRAAAFSKLLRSDRLAADYADEFERFPSQAVLPTLAKYRLDYLVVTGKDPRFRKQAFEYLSTWKLTRVGEIPEEQVEIFKVR